MKVNTLRMRNVDERRLLAVTAAVASGVAVAAKCCFVVATAAVAAPATVPS